VPSLRDGHAVLEHRQLLHGGLAVRHRLPQQPQRQALDGQLGVGVLRDQPRPAAGLLADPRRRGPPGDGEQLL
jgi:hypothetical protein